jgi:hypothetical protein
MSFHKRNPSLDIQCKKKRNLSVDGHPNKGVDDQNEFVLQSSQSSAGGGIPKTVMTNYMTQRDPLAVES